MIFLLQDNAVSEISAKNQEEWEERPPSPAEERRRPAGEGRGGGKRTRQTHLQRSVSQPALKVCLRGLSLRLLREIYARFTPKTTCLPSILWRSTCASAGGSPEMSSSVRVSERMYSPQASMT